MGEALVDLDGLDKDDGAAPAFPEKERAEVSMEARRRLERRLEEARLRKQIQDYDFDLD